MEPRTSGLEEESAATRLPSPGRMEELRASAKVVILGPSLDQEELSLMVRDQRTVLPFSTTFTTTESSSMMLDVVTLNLQFVNKTRLLRIFPDP